jgi:hypothetical protein
LLKLALLALLFGGRVARAEDVPNAPGWQLSKVTETTQEDNTYNDAKISYTLKPPDARPAITIDSFMADKLRAGDMSAEMVYSGQGKKKEDEEFVYGNHGNGIVMADDVNSTLTSEEGRKVEVASAPAAGSGAVHNTASAFAGMSGFTSNTGRGFSSGSGASSAHRNSSGASSAPPGAASASTNTATGGAPSLEDPRAVADAQYHASMKKGGPVGTGTSTNAQIFSGPSISIANNAQGFGMSTSTSSSNSTNFEIWPTGDPATSTSVSSSTATAVSNCPSKTYAQPTTERFTVPANCTHVKLSAWGGGGGYGGVSSANVLSGGKGGGGAYVHYEGSFDPVTFDVVVVVGGAGANGITGGGAALGGFFSGGAGGAGGGGGGGGYTGVFQLNRSMNPDPNQKPVSNADAIAVAAGGGGGSATGEVGGDGGLQNGGGRLGAAQMEGGPGSGSGLPGGGLFGGAGGGPGGGGGGGGGWAGGGGGNGIPSDAVATYHIEGGGGGTSIWLPGTSACTGAAGSNGTAGNPGGSGSGVAGNAGKPGYLTIQFY